jgi:hypothetical protein
MRKKQPKREITLMTILASEATKESRKLLKKYNRPDAKSYADLEVKLAELYQSTPDKFLLEKEMAEIHPHKKWIIKRLELDKPKEIKADVVEAEKPKQMPASTNIVCANPYCPIHGTIPMCEYSNASGNPMMLNPLSKPSGESKNEAVSKSPTDIIGLLGIVAIVGMTFFVLTKVRA